MVLVPTWFLWIASLLAQTMAVGGEGRAAETLRIEVVKAGSDELLLARNTSFAPVTITAALLSSSNCRVRWGWSEEDGGVVAAPRCTVLMATFGPLEEGSPWRYGYSHRCVIGDLHARQDPAVTYSSPLRIPSLCLQAFGDGASHRGRDFHAIDLACPVGTPVHAARGGRVVALEEDHREGPANYVRLLHADGTLGNYAHLRQGGAAVELGRLVARGELIGHSGATGCTGEPHLHFSVTNADPREDWRSLPFRLQGAAGPFVPQARTVIPASTPAVRPAPRGSGRDR